MAKHGKKYRAVKEKSNQDLYELGAAIEFLQANKTGNFDESTEIAFHMGVDPTKSDQAIRSTVSLPHGTGKNVRVLVFATGSAAEAAREAGADEVGDADLIEKVKGGYTDFDVAVATPEAMKDVRKLGRVLGPRGLMPNPKTGTVTDDVASAVNQSKAGRVEFRLDRHGNIQVPFGKLSFAANDLAENATTVIKALVAEKPAAAKGVYIKRCTVSSTMGVGLHVDIREMV